MSKRPHIDAASRCCLLGETTKICLDPSKLLEGLNRLRLDKLLCDVVLCCEGQEFPCHRVVLASLSAYFEAMFTSNMVESTQDRVEMVGVEPEVVDMLVRFAYTSELSISPANVQALLAGADLMEVTDVREACCDYMERHMTTSNCVEVHLLADRHSCEKLKESSMDYILEYFPAVYQQEGFLSTSVDKLTEILSSDHLSVPGEDMVFDAAISWLNTSTERRQTFHKVLEQIRVPLIRPSYLHTVMESLDVVKDLQACQSFISKAENYQRLLSEAEENRLQSYRNTARPRRTTVCLLVGLIERKLYSFDPKTQQSKFLTHLHDPRILASGSLLYETCESKGHFWSYDLQHGTWMERASSHIFAYSHCGVVMPGGCVFALWRRGGSSEISVDRYDPNCNTWQTMSKSTVNIPANDSLYYAEALDGLIYMFAGWSVYTYNPITGEWTGVVPMQSPRLWVSVCTLNGKIYAIGGISRQNEAATDVECYNPKTSQWTRCAPMIEPGYSLPVAAVDGMIYTIRTAFSRGIQRYCVETDRWETVGKMPAGLCFHGEKCGYVRLRNDSHSMPCDTAEDDDDDDDDDVHSEDVEDIEEDEEEDNDDEDVEDSEEEDDLL